MKTQSLPRIGVLGLVSLLCLLLVYQALSLPRSSSSRLHARDLVVPVIPELGPDQNLTVRAVRYGHLAERALDFETAVNKGNGLYCKCKARWQLSDESSWTTTEELERYYSEESYGIEPGNKAASAEWLEEALTAKGLPTIMSSNNGKDGNLVAEYWVQEKDWMTEVIAGGHTTRTTYDATYGFFMNVMSPKAGLIIAENNRSPAAMSSGQHCPLEKWSDVVWLSYAALARSTGSSVGNLKYLVRTHIVNPETKSVLKIVCGGPCPAWPGETFDINQKKKGGTLINQNGLALLGTPNGGGAAWLLINHKQQLGNKTPVSVIAWTTEGEDEKGNPEPWYHMIFQFSS
ncbi:hypothetical protein AbraIFM66950_006399 [Aspergillus brasiliensis]|nr:hypothetical protein AbraIFM66950_006399 [Aspergillus brasiliensis]